MSIPPLNDMVNLVAEHLLNGLILSAGIFVGGMVLLPLLFGAKRWSAATRHRVSLLTFIVLASTPLLVVLKPEQPNKPVPSAQPAATLEMARTTPITALISLPVLPPTKVEPGLASPLRSAWLDKVNWPLVLFAAWALLSAICLLRLAAAVYRLRVLHRSALPVAFTPELVASRRISVAESPLVSSPVAVGLWPAKVLLPLGFQSEFSLAEQKNVLLHEIAHLDRFDDWTNFLQQVLLAVFPINPFLWVISRLLQLNQEAACDDRVLAETQQAKSYASLLARLAAGTTRHALLVSGVSRQGKQLYQRLTRILDATRNRSVQPSVRSVMAAAVGLLGASVAGLIWMPAVVWTPQAWANETQRPMVPNDQEPSRSSLDPEIISLLTSSALNDPDSSVRQEAVSALSEHDGNDVTTALLALFNESRDEQVKVSILHEMNPRRASDARVRDKLNDLALHETSDAIRTAAIQLLSRHLDNASIGQLITIYRTANGGPVRVACLTGLGATDSKASREFLISVAKEDPDPQMRRIALRAITNDHVVPEEFVINGKPLRFNPIPPESIGGTILRRKLEAQQKVEEAQRIAQDQLRRRMEIYRGKVDTMNRLDDEGDAVTIHREPLPDGRFEPGENRFYYVNPGPGENHNPRFQGPLVAPKELPQEPKVDPSPKPSPSANE